MKRRGIAVVFLVAVIAVVAVAALANAGPSPTLTIASGVVPRMSAAEVIQDAQTRLAGMSTGVANPLPVTIVSLTATGASGVSGVEPGAGVDSSIDSSHVVWVVRATGTFVGSHVPPGVQPVVSNSGYILIDDETGEPIGMGMP